MTKIEKLFIYELTGSLQTSNKEMGHHFLGCWRESEYSYLFFSKPGKKAVQQVLSANHELKLKSEIVMDYDQWEPADALKPFEVPPLSFIPSFMGNNSSNEMTVFLDPGVVFGAGTHHTTHKCLEFLVDIMKDEIIHTIIDIGTGTGILALAAARLGADNVTAIDNNNLAVETAEKNVRLNRLEPSIQCLLADAADFLEQQADLTIANLILGEFRKLFHKQINYGSSWYIISGLNMTEVEDFKQIIRNLPFKIVRHEMENLWSTLLMRKM